VNGFNDMRGGGCDWLPLFDCDDDGGIRGSIFGGSGGPKWNIRLQISCKNKFFSKYQKYYWVDVVVEEVEEVVAAVFAVELDEIDGFVVEFD